MGNPADLSRGILVAIVLVISLVALSCAQPAQPTPTPKPAAPAQPAAATPKPAAPAQPTGAATAQPPKPVATQAPKPAAATPAAAKPTTITKVRLGHLGLTADGYSYIALEKGYLKEEGIDLDLVKFDTAANMIAPMAAGQLDVARGAPSAGLFNAIARDLPIKIVADSTSVVKGNDFFALHIRKDLADSGTMKDYADLKGKTIAHNAKATGNEIDVELALKKGNLSFSDVNAVEMPFPQMNVAFGNKAIDVGLIVEPFQTVGEQQGISAFWKPAWDFTPGHQVAVLMYAPGFMKDNPDVAKRYMVAYLKGIRDYYDAFFKNKNKSQVVSILTKYTSTKDPAMFDKMRAHGVNPDGVVNAKSLMDDQQWYKAKDYIKDIIPQNTLIDNQYIDYAMQRLGKYQ